MARGKPATPVDRNLLTNVIKTLESQQSFDNRSKLFDSVVTKYNEVADVPITASVVYTRINQWQLPLVTPKGKRGRSGGNPSLATANRTSREEKFSADDGIKAAFTALKKVTEPKHHGLVKRASKGSLTAIIKLKCLDCCCNDTQSIKECCVLSCPLWAVRPYSSADVNNKVIENQES